MPIAGKVGAVYISDTGTAPVPFTNEPTTDSGDHKRYQVTDPTCRYWALNVPIVVKVDGDVVAAGFVLEHAGGNVVFTEALASNAEVTVSGSALTLVQAGGLLSWSADLEADDLDATVFESGGWKEYIRGLIGWSGSAEAYWGDQRFFDNLGEIVLVKLYVDAGPSQRCFEGFALIKGVGIESNVTEIVTQSIDWTGIGPLYARV